MAIYLPENAPLHTRTRLEQDDTARALREAGTQFVVYDPQLADDDVLLLHFPFAWDGQARRVVAACTSGLCRNAQSQPRKWCFEKFEVAVAFYSDGFSEAMLQQMLLLMRDVREWMNSPAHPAFGIGDWIEHFPLLASRPSALLIPPTPELVQAGLRPFSSSTSALEIRDWVNPDALMRAGSRGFLQIVPIFESEFAHVASTKDGFRFLLQHLLASDG